MELPDKKYGVIVVDPPWPVKKLKIKVRPNQVAMDYATMSVSDIQDLQIGTLARNPSFCFLWSTQKFLFKARPVLEHWGFHYLMTLVWEKTYGRSAGMPLAGFRWNAEFILVGTKGKFEMFPKRPLIPAVFQAENIRHSQKPDKFYQMVEGLSDARIDLFARRHRDGWDVWGDEVKEGSQPVG